MVLVTTNEPVVRLHPAVCRPGRCAALVDFELLSSEETAAWLAARDAPPLESERPATLAELFAIVEGQPTPRPAVRRVVGFRPGG